MVPIVPRPPTLTLPKRANGEEQVVMLGVTLRITMTAEGSAGVSLELMVNPELFVRLKLECNNSGFGYAERSGRYKYRRLNHPPLHYC